MDAGNRDIIWVSYINNCGKELDEIGYRYLDIVSPELRDEELESKLNLKGLGNLEYEYFDEALMRIRKKYEDEGLNSINFIRYQFI